MGCAQTAVCDLLLSHAKIIIVIAFMRFIFSTKKKNFTYCNVMVVVFLV